MSSHNTFNSQSQSWTDDLPVCKNTGIGFSINQIYRADGHPQEAHPYEDFTSNFKFDACDWYAVFDGHEGKKAAEYCSQRMSAEICFSQIENKTDEEIKELLRQAFITVERAYLDTMGEILAEKTALTWDLPKGKNPYELLSGKPQYNKLARLDRELACGTSSAVALIFNNKLYVANVGNCRVLLCQTDQNSVLKVIQLSIDHDLKNEDELLRLSQIGINVKKLGPNSSLGNQESTRCLGNYLLKGSYKEYDILSSATQEPITAEPDIQSKTLDESCRFLLLMSSGLYKSIEEATGSDQVNKFIAQCVVEQFREQSNLTGVAQAVVDKVVHMHRDAYLSKTLDKKCFPKREDMTLILRNFNYPLPKAINSPVVTFNPIVTSQIMTDDDREHTLTGTSVNTIRTNTTSSSEEVLDDEGVGPDQKINAYVDFSEFYNNYMYARDTGTLPPGLSLE